MAWQTFHKQVYTNNVTKQAIITYIFTLFKKICLIHKSKQTVYWQPIDKKNWGTFVKAACMYTNYCLSFFIMNMHLLVQLGKLKHAETAIWRKCSSPYARTSSTSFTEQHTAWYFFLTFKPYSKDGISLTWCHF